MPTSRRSKAAMARARVKIVAISLQSARIVSCREISAAAGIESIAVQAKIARTAVSSARENPLPPGFLCVIGVSLSPPGEPGESSMGAVSYTHLRAHETRHDLVCRLL